MNNICIDVKQSFKHVGVILCTTRKEEKIALEKRISAARKVVLASRSIGSLTVPVPPSTLSKMYWSVAIPKMVYGLDVSPLSENDICDLEAAHRNNAKTIQGIPVSSANPSVLAPLGWLSISSLIAMMQMLFMFRTLCMPFRNVYKETILVKLREICEYGDIDANQFKVKSPVMSMLCYAKQYGLTDKIKNCLINDDFGMFSSWKTIVKKVVWKFEASKWKLSCSMYSCLNVYNMSLTTIGMCVWWKLAKFNPRLVKKAACLMAVLCGGQPVKMQCNFESRMCKLCDMRARDDAEHNIMICPRFAPKRKLIMDVISTSMPPAMQDAFAQYNNATKLTFLLSGLGVDFTPEWHDTYKGVLMLVFELYKQRKELYDEISDVLP